MKKKKIMITGAGGYIGSVATSLFLEDGFEIVALDNFSTGYQSPLKFLQNKYGKHKLRFYKIDLNHKLSKLLEHETGICAVAHYAACCSVDESMKNPQKYFINNVGSSLNLLSIMAKFKINNIVYSSTCAVYGEAQYIPIDESHPTLPSNPYGQSKRIIEQMIEWYGKLANLNYIILRYFNVCGASDDGLIGDSKKPSILLVQNAVRGALELEPFFLTCPKVNTPDKTPIRDYINVIDLNIAHVKAMNYLLDGGKSEIINLGTGKGNSVLEIVDKVQQLTGTSLNMKKGRLRRGEYAVMIAAIKKAKKILNWQPQRSIDDSINSLISWYKSHPSGWKH